MITYRPIDLSIKGIQEVEALLNSVFTKNLKKTFEFLDWEYNQNPAGKALGYNAFHNNSLIAHFVAQPIFSNLAGKRRKGLFALHVATHPDFRGKGLFYEVNNRTFEQAKNNGYEFVVGISNQQSTNVYVKKLGFQLIAPLEVKIGFGLPKFAAKINQTYEYERLWDEEILSWRLKNPLNSYSFIIKSPLNYIFGKTNKIGFKILMTGTSHIYISKNLNQKTKGNLYFNIWYGFGNEYAWTKTLYFNFPKFLRPSPLNFILKSLTDKEYKLNPSVIKFNPIDHDAY